MSTGFIIGVLLAGPICFGWGMVWGEEKSKRKLQAAAFKAGAVFGARLALERQEPPLPIEDEDIPVGLA